MGRGPALRARDVDAIRNELAPAFAQLRYLAKRHGVTVNTLIKHAMLPEPIDVRPVRIKSEGFDTWNEGIGEQ